MFDTEHIHYEPTPDKSTVCIDIVRLAGQVIAVSWYGPKPNDLGRADFDFRGA